MGPRSLLKWVTGVELNDTTVIMEILRYRRTAREYLLISQESLVVFMSQTDLQVQHSPRQAVELLRSANFYYVSLELKF
jgi:hypothetical protein